MKVDILDAHDRYRYFTEGSFSIGECCQAIIDSEPFGPRPFYIFAHARTDDVEPGVKRLIWQPRLTKPRAETNSMLFKAYPPTDLLKIIWMIPAREFWSNFAKGNLLENSMVSKSIYDFEHDREKLEAKEEDDLSDEEITEIYKEIAKKKELYRIKSVKATPEKKEESLDLSE